VTGPQVTDRRLVILTPAQRRVLGEITRDGADNPVIAARLGITKYTVSAHVKAILRAFDQSNRTAVAVDCLRGRVSIRVETKVLRPRKPPGQERAA
jgi:DNA-binding NarL/FixJ family response regulator